MKNYSYLDVRPRLTYEKDEKYEYNLYNGIDNFNSGQIRFHLTPESVEDLFRLMSYFTSKGWFEKMSFRNTFIPEIDGDTYWMTGRKTRKQYEAEPKIEDLDRNKCMEFWITIDKDRLEEFRQLLKSIPGFKVTWVEQGIDKLI